MSRTCAKCEFEIDADQVVTCALSGCKKSYHKDCAKIKDPVKGGWCCSNECQIKLALARKCYDCGIPFTKGEKVFKCGGEANCSMRRHEICLSLKCSSCLSKDKPSIVQCMTCEEDVEASEKSYSCIECGAIYHDECTVESGLHCPLCKIPRSKVDEHQRSKIADQKAKIETLEKMADLTMKKFDSMKEKNEKQAAETSSLKKLMAEMAEKLQNLETRGSSKPKDNFQKLKERFFDMDDTMSSSDSSSDSDDDLDFCKEDLQEFLIQRPYAEGSPEMTNAMKFRKPKQNYDLKPFDGDIRLWPAFVMNFKSSTQRGQFQDDENADRLRVALSGKAIKYAGTNLAFTCSGAQIMCNLKKYCGRSEIISIQLADNLMAIKKCSSISDRSIIDFSTEFGNYVETVKSMGWTDQLQNSYLLNKLELKLCSIHYDKWSRKRAKYEARNLEAVSLEHFAKFLRSIATRFPPEFMEGGEKSSEEHKRDRNRHLNLHEASTSGASSSKPVKSEKKWPPCSFCNGEHAIYKCDKFKKLSVDSRNDYVFENNICSCCLLNTKHTFSQCKARQCKTCNGRHNTLLHGARPKAKRNEETVHNNLHLTGTSDVLHKVVPIRLRKKDGSLFDTFALLDDCAGVTMIDEGLFDQLGLSYHDQKWLQVTWTSNVTRRGLSKRCDIEISPAGNAQAIQLRNVYTVKKLELLKQNFNANEMKQRYKHLRGLRLSDLVNAQPTILIGLRHSKTLVVEKNILGEHEDDPIASKTPLGWTVWGSVVKHDEQEFNPQSAHYHQARIYSHTVEEFDIFSRKAERPPKSPFYLHKLDDFDIAETEDKIVNEMVREYFTSEDFGFIPRSQLLSVNDKRALEIMSSSIRQEPDKHYSMSLPWKSDDVELPDNFEAAVHRMKLDEQRVEKLGLTQWKSELFHEYLRKGYIRLATEEDLNTKWKRIWYLPHFVTFNMNKIPPKARNVFDAAAKVRGIALNSVLLTGPDNLSPLLRSLFRLRENRIAYIGDIKEMFSQFRIQAPDDQCQRFLFRDGDFTKDPRECIYIHQSMAFGPTSSPFMAQFAKNFHAEKFKEKFPEAYDVITKFTYVDDSSDSQPTLEEAFEVAMALIDVYREGGMELVNIISNSLDLLKMLPAENVKREFLDCDFDNETELISKILGLRWSPKDDVFTFPLRVDDNLTAMRGGDVTKRRMLRMVMQIFDPLGFLSNLTVRGRQLVHLMWRHGYDWDVKVKEELQDEWKEFEQELLSLVNVRIPRQFAPVDPKDYDVHQMVFVDASDKAYAAVSYLKFINKNNPSDVHIGFAKAKSRLRGSKYRSVPKLELDAALLGVRLAKDVESMLSFKIASVKYFSDSRTVLSWISSNDCKFAPYVEPRIAEIWESSTSAQWFYVPTRHNVADEATKWSGIRQFTSDGRWFRGPDFLYESEENWPTKPCLELKNAFVVAESSAVYVHTSEEEDDRFAFIDDIDRTAMKTWIEFLRAVATADKQQTVQDGTQVSTITPDDVRSAQTLVFRKVQTTCFGLIVKKLKNIQDLFKEGKILKAEYIERYNDIVGPELRKDRPFVDDDGIMRMRSRYQSPAFTYDKCNPPIVPPDHPLVEFLVTCYHKQNFHCLDRTTKADLAEICWIHKLGNVLRHVKSKCEECIQLRGKRETPLMGDLHPARLDFASRPWTHVGVDAFGPFDCKYGARSTIKRWAFIFTDLTYRGVHIELVSNMTTDACLMAIRRFISMRNIPKRFYSDNGTNYIGANNKMQKDFLDMKEELGEAVAKQKNIEWQFIAVSSPWMGASWERLIGVIKKCLDFAFKSEVYEEEVLRTALYEISFLMNRRPLTEFPSDPSDEKPLTPNSLTIGDHCNDINLTVGIFGDGDNVSSLRYRRVEHVTQKYMKRFIREYLPTIARREKWTTEKVIKVGDTAFLYDKDVKDRRFWKKVTIVKVHPGRDGVVRVVDYRIHEEKPKTMKYRGVGNLIMIEN